MPKHRSALLAAPWIFNRADKVIDRIDKKRKEKEEKEADDSGINDQDVEIQGLETAHKITVCPRK